MFFAVLFVTAAGYAQVQTTATKSQSAAHRQGPKAKKYNYTCTMHPEVRRTKAGKCPKCKMKMVRIRPTKMPPVAPI